MFHMQGYSLWWLAQMVKQTSRYQIEGLSHLDEARNAGKPIIFVAWHGMTMMLAGFFQNHLDSMENLVLMMPDDWRGEALQYFTHRLGATPFPMNLKEDNSMAMARQFIKLVRLVKQGKDTYMTPDGPGGPAYVVKPGVAYLAQKTGATLLPVGAYVRAGYRLKRWDQYVVPYPFSRISLVIGEQVKMPASSTTHTTITQPLTDTLHRVTAQAAANFYEK